MARELRNQRVTVPVARMARRSVLMRSTISSRCTVTLCGALIPIRTWFPFTPSTVTVTSLPMITDSWGFLVTTNMCTSDVWAWTKESERAILSLSPGWEQEELPLYVLLLIRGRHGKTTSKCKTPGADESADRRPHQGRYHPAGAGKTLGTFSFVYR